MPLSIRGIGDGIGELGESGKGGDTRGCIVRLWPPFSPPCWNTAGGAMLAAQKMKSQQTRARHTLANFAISAIWAPAPIHPAHPPAPQQRPIGHDLLATWLHIELGALCGLGERLARGRCPKGIHGVSRFLGSLHNQYSTDDGYGSPGSQCRFNGKPPPATPPLPPHTQHSS